jgi:hypothetical protein
MHSSRPLRLFVPLVAVASLCSAQPVVPPMQPGLWELKVVSTLAGRADPPASMRECIAQKDLDDEQRTLPRPDGDCRLSNVVRSGNRTSYDIACRQNSVTSVGRMELFHGVDMYDGKADLRIITPGKAEAPMSVTINARRIGDCSK